MQAKLETLIDDEEDVEVLALPPPSGKKFGGFNDNKGDDPNNFSNENVMSKSNLRQPKSFNFGFPEGDDSDEEVQQAAPFEEEEVQNFVHNTLPRNLL